jgi:hypothetical protein
MQRFFFEKRKERKALRPLRNNDKEIKIFALFTVNKTVRQNYKTKITLNKCYKNP